MTSKVLQHHQTGGVLETGSARKTREEGEKITPKMGLVIHFDSNQDETGWDRGPFVQCFALAG